MRRGARLSVARQGFDVGQLPDVVTPEQFNALVLDAWDDRTFERRVVELFLRNGWLAYHSQRMQGRDGRYRTPLLGSPGFPDVVAAKVGHAPVFAELKVGTGRLERQQRAWRDALMGQARWFCWYPRDWDAIVAIAEEVWNPCQP